MTEPQIEPKFIILSPEQVAARKRRNVWIALGLVAFIVLLFTTTFLRMQHNQKAERDAHGAAASTMTPPVTGAAG